MEQKNTGMYHYQNVGFAPVDEDEKNDTGVYQYHNVGFPAALPDEVNDAGQYHYQNVEARPAGSKTTLPPTIN